MNNLNEEIVIDVWGDYACFTRPEFKVERVSYECITPSAARGILNAIYSKPKEFYYQITAIDIINPIKTINIKKNEFCKKTDSKTLKPIYQIKDGKTNLTQRNNIYLKNVYYRIHAKIKKQVGCNKSLNGIYEQFNRRVEKGKCYFEPCLGTRECLCYFSKPNTDKQPLKLNKSLGIMLYDVFNIENNIPLDTNKQCHEDIFQPSFFDANIVNGSITVPSFNSNLVYKKGE